MIDSAGITVEDESEWQCRKHGSTKRRVWRKIHIAIYAQILEIRAVELTPSSVGDAPALPDLLNQTAPQEKIACVTAPFHYLQANRYRATDGAYDTRACHDAIAARGALAVIPPRRNAPLWKPATDCAKARNEALHRSTRLGRALWRKCSGYHRRSRVKAKMSWIKHLGQRLMAGAFDRLVAEVKIRAAILNRFTGLGTPTTTRVA